MATAEEKFIKNWKKQREIGKRGFILKFGIIYCAFTSVFYYLIDVYILKLDSDFVSFSGPHLYLHIGIMVFFFMLAGFGVTWFNWNINEKRFKKVNETI